MNFPHGFHLELLVLLLDNVVELIRTSSYRVYFLNSYEEECKRRSSKIT